MNRFRKLLSFFVGILIPLAVGGLAAILTMSAMKEYSQLVRPPLSPPSWAFPIAWTLLYILMGTASVLVWRSYDGKKQEGLTYYAFQLILNFFWTVIFFNAKEYTFAFIWLLALLAVVILTTVYFSKQSKAAGILMLPYILWLVFAAYLNLGVAILN